MPKGQNLKALNKKRAIHNKSKDRIYTIWRQMKNRCLKKNNKDYHRYGGRGIKICKRWLIAKNFFDDMGDPPNNKMQLNRINNNGDYKPSNCKWSTAMENSNNKRTSIFISYKGKKKTIAQWARILHICPKTLGHRINAKWPIDAVFTLKVNRGNRHKIKDFYK